MGELNIGPLRMTRVIFTLVVLLGIQVNIFQCCSAQHDANHGNNANGQECCPDKMAHGTQKRDLAGRTGPDPWWAQCATDAYHNVFEKKLNVSNMFQNHTIKLDDYKGKVLLLVNVASW